MPLGFRVYQQHICSSWGLQQPGTEYKVGLKLPLHWEQELEKEQAGGVVEVARTKDFQHFYADRRIALKLSGNKGRKNETPATESTAAS